MFIEFTTTTITHRIEVGDDGIKGVTHSVDIEGGEDVGALPKSVLMAIVEGGCKATINTVTKSKPTIEDKPIIPTADEELRAATHAHDSEGRCIKRRHGGPCDQPTPITDEEH